MALKYTNIYHSKALQNLPKFGIFWFENKPSGNPDLEMNHRYQSNRSRVMISACFCAYLRLFDAMPWQPLSLTVSRKNTFQKAKLISFFVLGKKRNIFALGSFYCDKRMEKKMYLVIFNSKIFYCCVGTYRVRE
jgi:hypothetical protein